jgi:glycosyltransferase involved in cell wall biosynthesis
MIFAAPQRPASLAQEGRAGRTMKICRITKYLPGINSRPGVQHAYFLTQYIQEPTLIIAKKNAYKSYPLPSYAAIKEISYSDSAFTSNLEAGFLQNGRYNWKQRIRYAARFLIKIREIVFFLKSIPVLVKFKPDIVHSHGLITLLPGVFAKAFLGSRQVITLHNVTEVILARQLRFVRHLLNYPDKIICVSNVIRQQLSEMLPPEKLEVIPTALDPEIFRNLQVPRKNQMIAVGYFKWQKGYRHMIEAMTSVFAKFDDYRLLIAGDGPELEEIRKMIERLNLTEKVRLLGAVSQEEIAKHLNESKLFVMSSLVEGLPKALLEAIACGTPAVLTTACNAEEIIDQVGIAVKPGDSRALAAAIEELLEDYERWNQLSENCLAVAQDYRWETISSKTLDLYRKL